MTLSTKIRSSIVLLSVAALAACAGTQPPAYNGLASAPELQPSKIGNPHIRFIYTASDVGSVRYDSVMLDPTIVYSGPDAQFNGKSASDRLTIAHYVDQQFAHRLASQFRIVDVPSPTTLRIHPVLAGIETNTPVLSTITKLVPGGILLNSVQSARGAEGSFMGSVSLAVEVRDSQSSKLLKAFVEKQYPFAENVTVSLLPLDATRAGVRNAADDLVAELGSIPVRHQTVASVVK